MAILTRLASESNANLVQKIVDFFERFVPDNLLVKCNVVKAADFAEEKTSCSQLSFFHPPDESPIVKDETQVTHPLGYTAKGILQDKVTFGFLSETFNQSKHHDGSFGITTQYSAKTWYRFDHLHANWERLEMETAANIISYIKKDSMPYVHKGSLAIDDSLFPRKIGVHGEKSHNRMTELVGWVYDHTIGKNKIGFRMMTALWTDGSNSIPVAQALLATRREDLMIGPVIPYDRRTWEGMRRKVAITKGTDVFVKFVKRALDAGIEFDEVLTDTWFSNPAQAIEIMKLGTHLIAMAKKGNAKYGILPEDSKINPKKVKASDLLWLNSKEIYSRCKKRRGTSDYLLSIEVWVKDTNGVLYPMKLVYARNRSNRKDWVVFLCTNRALPEKEVLMRYCFRWNIERYFKVAKSFLGLLECHSTSYDALTANVTIVALRFMVLSVELFDETVPRTIEQIFNSYRGNATEQLVKESCLMFGDELLNSCERILRPTDEQVKALVLDFISHLPDPFQSYFDPEKISEWKEN